MSVAHSPTNFGVPTKLAASRRQDRVNRTIRATRCSTRSGIPVRRPLSWSTGPSASVTGTRMERFRARSYPDCLGVWSCSDDYAMSGGEGPPEGRTRVELASEWGSQSVRFLVVLRLRSLRTVPLTSATAWER